MSTAADFAVQAEESDLQGEFADCAELVGINMEGPYISPSKVGAQNPSFVRRASVDEFATLQEVSDGLIAICDIAPEEPGALDFIEYLTASGVRASVAHTTADYTAAMSAFEAGVCQLTHTFNAMPGLHHRTPGPIAAAADCDWVRPELIADGIHIHPSMIRLAFKLFGAERMLLVSDTMRACGLDDGVYDLGGQDVTVAGKVATVNDGALAGSVSDLATCVEYAVSRAGIDLADAIRAASYNPACALGLNGYAGELVPGAKADIVILDSEAHLRQSILRGRVM
jgi:N-acetylglucosamine-6-phosphate deacetylase